MTDEKCPKCGRSAVGTIVDGMCGWCWRDESPGEIEGLRHRLAQAKAAFHEMVDKRDVLRSQLARRDKEIKELHHQLAQPPVCWCGKPLEPAHGQPGKWNACETCIKLTAQGAAEALHEENERLRGVITDALPALEAAAKQDRACLGTVAPPVDADGIPESEPWAVVDEMIEQFREAAQAAEDPT